MIDVDLANLISILQRFYLLFFLFDLCFDELPDVVLGDVVGGVGTARDLVESLAVRMFDFMGV